MVEPPARDEIVFRDMVLPCRVGVLSGEADRPQPLRLQLRVFLDLAPAGRSDQLADTLDYGALAGSVAAALERQSFGLLEAVAERVAEVILGDPRVTRVDVRVEKVHPPLPAAYGPVGVRIRRGRGESS
jgi:FolB domain-containing protein